MPEIIPHHVPSPRTPLVWDGTRYRAVRGHTDGTLQVRGEDQLFSIRGAVRQSRTAVISGVGGYIDSPLVSAGRYWVITNISASDNTNATTQHTLSVPSGGSEYYFAQEIRAFGVGAGSFFHGLIFLEATAVVRVFFGGALAGDICTITLTGYEMTLEV